MHKIAEVKMTEVSEDFEYLKKMNMAALGVSEADLAKVENKTETLTVGLKGLQVGDIIRDGRTINNNYPVSWRVIGQTIESLNRNRCGRTDLAYLTFCNGETINLYDGKNGDTKWAIQVERKVQQPKDGLAMESSEVKAAGKTHQLLLVGPKDLRVGDVIRDGCDSTGETFPQGILGCVIDKISSRIADKLLFELRRDGRILGEVWLPSGWNVQVERKIEGLKTVKELGIQQYINMTANALYVGGFLFESLLPKALSRLETASIEAELNKAMSNGYIKLIEQETASCDAASADYIQAVHGQITKGENMEKLILAMCQEEARKMIDLGIDPRDVLGALDDVATGLLPVTKIEAFRAFVNANVKARAKITGEPQPVSLNCAHGKRAESCIPCNVYKEQYEKRSDSWEPK